MKNDYESIELIEDSDGEEIDTVKKDSTTNHTKKHEDNITITDIPDKNTKNKKTTNTLKKYYFDNHDIYEIGVDEAGRGPLFGRVYTAAVILPKDDTFDFAKMKDSKKFHSKKKIEEVAEYIRENALAWHVSYEDERKIDEINILQATQESMHKSIHETMKKWDKKIMQNNHLINTRSYHLLIDGNYFNPITKLNKDKTKMEIIPYNMIKGGDNTYASIAAASILAKVERDKYIEQLCEENPELDEYYGIKTNKGYGAKKHMEGIQKHGITIWHRRSFGPCKNA